MEKRCAGVEPSGRPAQDVISSQTGHACAPGKGSTIPIQVCPSTAKVRAGGKWKTEGPRKEKIGAEFTTLDISPFMRVLAVSPVADKSDPLHPSPVRNGIM